MKSHILIASDSVSPLDKLLGFLRLVLMVSALLIALRSTSGRAESVHPAVPSKNSKSVLRDSEITGELKVTRDARGRKVQVVDFSEVLIEGQARTPEGLMLQSRKSGRFKSLIELRRHFRDNIKLHALDIGAAPVTGD
jgi:hypothetical protein